MTTSTATLHDGHRIIVRPIEGLDRPLLEAAFARLSTESRYRRFLAATPELTARQFDYLVNVDHHDHEALVALEEGGEVLIGIARYVRIAPTVAEPAVTVADDWQGRGVGTALLERLVSRAVEAGIGSFSASFFADNPAPLRLLGQAGDVTIHRGGTVSQVDVVLTVDAAAPPISPLRALLRTVATGTLEPTPGWWQRLFPRPGE